MKIENLIRFAEGLVEEDLLDDMVYDACQEIGLNKLNSIEDPEDQEDHICDYERIASQINSEGYDSQIRFLIKSGVPLRDIEEVLHNG